MSHLDFATNYHIATAVVWLAVKYDIVKRCRYSDLLSDGWSHPLTYADSDSVGYTGGRGYELAAQNKRDVDSPWTEKPSDDGIDNRQFDV